MSTQDKQIEADYPLTLSIGHNLAMVCCAGVVTVGIGMVAANNNKGLIVAGFSLDASNATIVYWIMTFACGLFALPLTLAMAYRAAFIHQRIAFTRSSLWLPRTNWSKEIVEVPFGDIKSASVWSYGSERVVTITLADRVFRVGQSWLPTSAAFDEVVGRLAIGMKSAQAQIAPRD